MLETAAAGARPPGRAAHVDDVRPTSSSRRSRPTPSELPTIVGELYFEYHRGTYTTQAAVKRGNREGERALHDADLLAALAARTTGAEHPGGRLAELWQLLLLNQFHDILPGSSIALVYEDAARDHAAVRAGADDDRGRRVGGAGGAGRRLTPFNTIGFARAEVASEPDGEPGLGRGARVRVRRRRAGAARGRSRPRSPGDGVVLENGVLRAELGRDGLVRSLVALGTGREALAAAGERAPGLRRPPDGVRCVGRRPVPSGDGGRLPAGDVMRAPIDRAVAGGGRRSSGRSGGPARCGRSCASTRARGGSNSTARSTGASRTRC